MLFSHSVDRFPGHPTVIARSLAFALLVSSCLSGCHSEPPASTLLRPPPLTPPSPTTGVPQLRETLDGWHVEGAVSLTPEGIEMGGSERTTLTLEELLPPGAGITLDVFQEGSGASLLHVTPVVSGKFSNLAQPLALDFDLSEFVYRRWHHAEITTGLQDGHANIDARVTVEGGTLGKQGDYLRHFPADPTVRFRLSLEVEAGSKLHVRNLFLKLPGAHEDSPATTPEAPPGGITKP